jgi:hypothetical protein
MEGVCVFELCDHRLKLSLIVIPVLGTGNHAAMLDKTAISRCGDIKEEYIPVTSTGMTVD